MDNVILRANVTPSKSITILTLFTKTVLIKAAIVFTAMPLQSLIYAFRYPFTILTYLLPATLFLIALYLLLINKRKNIRYSHLETLLPGPETVPFIGNSLDFIKGGNFAFRKLQQYIKQYDSKPFRFWIGSELFVVLSDVEDMYVASNSSLSKPTILTTLRDFFGENLFTYLDAPSVKHCRRQFAPAFNTNFMLKYLTTFVNEAKTTMNVLSKHCNTNQLFNMWDLFPYITLDIVAKTMMGTEIDEEVKSTKFHNLNKRGLNHASMRAVTSLAQFPVLDKFICKITSDHLRQKFVEFSEKILQRKFHQIQKQCDENGGRFYSATEDNGIMSAPYSIAAYKLYLEKNDPSVFYNEMSLIAAAGTDTTAIVMSYFMLIISIHQDIQERIYRELYEIYGDSERETTVEDLKKMPYTEQAIKETLRHLTLVPFVFRYTDRELKIRDLTLPAGTNTMLLLFNVHYNPEYYPEPHKFNPDNFSEEAVSSRPKYTFVPFANGARDCIGKRFAMMEMKVILSTILRRFKFGTTTKMEDIKLDRDYLTTIADNNYSIFIHDR